MEGGRKGGFLRLFGGELRARNFIWFSFAVIMGGKWGGFLHLLFWGIEGKDFHTFFICCHHGQRSQELYGSSAEGPTNSTALFESGTYLVFHLHADSWEICGFIKNKILTTVRCYSHQICSASSLSYFSPRPVSLATLTFRSLLFQQT